MKTIEEKAKAYDKAIEKATQSWECGDITRENLEYIFQELHESEDEKIRKWLIDTLKGYHHLFEEGGVTKEDMLSWLEKQGELKSSKWAEGDVVRHGGILALVTNGRKAMKSNYEQITIQYPDEWVKAETKERKYFFDELEKQGEKLPAGFYYVNSKGEKFYSKKFKYNNVVLSIEKQGENEETSCDRCKKEQPFHSCKDITYTGSCYMEGEQKSIDYGEEFKKCIDNPLYFYDRYVKIAPKRNVEPKFKVGDWVIDNNGKVAIIYDLQKAGYVGHYTDGTDFICKYSDEHLLHLWTIQDAKDGDVLVYHNTATEIIMLFKSWVIDRETAYTHFHIFDNDFRVNNSCDCGNGAHPATKEQRDLLFEKMKEAGYTFDFEKKELSKLVIDEGKAEMDYCFTKMMNGEKVSHVWSEDDEEKFRDVIRLIEQGAPVQSMRDHYTNWFKSLKDRVLPQPKQEWGEEDEHRVKDTIYFLETAKKHYASTVELDACIDWLKNIKDRVQPQPKQEWSEKDEQAIEDAESWLDTLCDYLKDSSSECIPMVKEVISKLKSLKERYIWKPSESPHWKKSSLPNDKTTGFNSDNFCYNGYYINYKELFNKLPKDD